MTTQRERWCPRSLYSGLVGGALRPESSGVIRLDFGHRFPPRTAVVTAQTSSDGQNKLEESKWAMEIHWVLLCRKLSTACNIRMYHQVQRAAGLSPPPWCWGQSWLPWERPQHPEHQRLVLSLQLGGRSLDRRGAPPVTQHGATRAGGLRGRGKCADPPAGVIFVSQQPGCFGFLTVPWSSQTGSSSIRLTNSISP